MSENILKQLCNRLLNLFKQTEKTEENAKDVACNRLRVVLMQDRTNLTPELLQRMRKELIELLSKYVEMDKDALELNLDQEDGQMALMLSIPVIRAKDEEEIEKVLAEEKAKSENNEESEEDSDSEDDDNDSDNDETSENETSTEDESEKEVEEEPTEESDDNDTDSEKENTEEIEISEGEENK